MYACMYVCMYVYVKLARSLPPESPPASVKHFICFTRGVKGQLTHWWSNETCSPNLLSVLWILLDVCFSRLPRCRMSSPLLLSLTRWREAVRQRVINADWDTYVVPRGPTALIGATASHKLEGRVRVWRTESTALAFREEFHAAWTSQSLGSTDDCSETRRYVSPDLLSVP